MRNDEKRTVVKTEKTTTIDSETGQIIEETNSVVSNLKEAEPPFIKLYIEDIGRLKELSPSTVLVLGSLVRNMSYSGLMFSIKPIKEMIMKDTGLSYPSVRNAFVQLANKNILIRKARAVYLIDPNLFARGSWKDIKKLRLVIDYHPNGTKTINSNMANQLQLWNDDEETKYLE